MRISYHHPTPASTSTSGNSPPDKDAGSQSYFGAVPPQVLENLLWFYTEPGDTVVDLFAGSGTTIDVAKAMGRRVWASLPREDKPLSGTEWGTLERSLRRNASGCWVRALARR
jgi:hypothetical protein